MRNAGCVVDNAATAPLAAHIEDFAHPIQLVSELRHFLRVFERQGLSRLRVLLLQRHATTLLCLMPVEGLAALSAELWQQKEVGLSHQPE